MMAGRIEPSQKRIMHVSLYITPIVLNILQKLGIRLLLLLMLILEHHLFSETFWADSMERGQIANAITIIHNKNEAFSNAEIPIL